ncbi:hypothetical protein N9D38_02400 [Rubripirellula sp.]|jgi:hypothetical protein|nr:hypothetical protein [Rubripirellula sp.]
MANRWLALVCFATVGSALLACNIPVFRYALERWNPDACEMILFHSGPLQTDEEIQLRKLLPSRIQGWSHSETVVASQSLGALSFVDLQTANEDQKKLWNGLSKTSSSDLPYLLVRGSVGSTNQFPLWKGPLSELEQASLFRSPARVEMSRRLLAGDAVVWLLVTGLDQEKNEAIRQRLDLELPRLAKQIQLPEGIGLPGSELFSEVPLLVQYSYLEIDRNDGKESFLIDLFSSIRPLEVSKGEPLVIPVFGRGRALEVIPGSELNPHLMTDLTLFLSGACSCQVKEQNPGFDLLIDCDWKDELFPEGDEPPPARSIGQGAKRGQSAAPQLLDIPRGR